MTLRNRVYKQTDCRVEEGKQKFYPRGTWSFLRLTRPKQQCLPRSVILVSVAVISSERCGLVIKRNYGGRNDSSENVSHANSVNRFAFSLGVRVKRHAIIHRPKDAQPPDKVARVNLLFSRELLSQDLCNYSRTPAQSQIGGNPLAAPLPFFVSRDPSVSSRASSFHD